MYNNIKFVKKRDNKIEDYDMSRIEASVLKALKEINEFDEELSTLETVAKKLSFEVSSMLDNAMKPEDEGMISIEDIYDTIQDILFDTGYHNTAKKYIRNRYESIIAFKDREIASLKAALKNYHTI